MGKSTDFSTNFQKLLETNVDYTGVGDAGGLLGSAAPGSLYISLHTGDPGLTGDQTVNEATYTGYGRQGVVRSGVGWTVAAGQATNAGNITFGLCTAGVETITWFGVGTDSAGVGQLLYAFPLISTYYACFGHVTNDEIFNLSGLLANDPIQFLSLPTDPLPNPIVQGTTYYVKTILTADSFTISGTAGGLVISILAGGAGLLGKIAPLAIAPGVTPQFLAGQLVLKEV